MPAPNLIDERKRVSEDRINLFKDAVLSLPRISNHADLCIYVTGSFGRLEASEYSDLDLFFVKESDPGNDEESCVHDSLMDALKSKCRDMGFPEFSGDSEYLEVHYLKDMRDNLGGRDDDYQNLFTARLLLLLESLPIYNELLYENVLGEITSSYFRDYEDHEEDFHPTFLVNDILRFWKTLCLNYEHRRNAPAANEEETRKSSLRNLKLKFSRMLTCFSLVIPLSVPRDSIGPEECIHLMQERPLERLKTVATRSKNPKLWYTIAGEYSWFLDLTGRPRDEVLNWMGSSHNRMEAFDRSRCFGDTMYELLITVATRATLRYLVI